MGGDDFAVGGSLLWRVVAEVSGQSEAALTAAYRKHGDLGAVAGELLPERSGQGLSVLEVAEAFRRIATVRGPAAKSALVRDLLERATPLEAKYVVKIVTGDLRIGLKESLVEEAIAKAYDATLGEVQRANMLHGGYRRDAAAGGCGQAGRGENAVVSSLGIHAGEPDRVGRRGVELFHRGRGRGQV